MVSNYPYANLSLIKCDNESLFGNLRVNDDMALSLTTILEETSYHDYKNIGAVSILNSPSNIRREEAISDLFDTMIILLSKKLYNYHKPSINIAKLNLETKLISDSRSTNYDDISKSILDKSILYKYANDVLSMINDIFSRETDLHGILLFRIKTDNMLYDATIYQDNSEKYIVDIDLISRTSIFAASKRLYVDKHKNGTFISSDIAGIVRYNIPGTNVSHGDKYKFTMDWFVILHALLKEYLQALVNNSDSTAFTIDKFYEYNKYELEFVKYLLQQKAPRKEKSHMLAVAVGSYRKDHDIPDSIDFNECDTYVHLIADLLNRKLNITTFPLIDFNKREFQWVSNYCKNRPDTYTYDGGTMDIVDILTFMKYGYTYRMPIQDIDNLKSKSDILISIDYDIEKNQMYGYIMDYNYNENIVYAAVLKFDNIKEWNPMNVVVINTYAYINIHYRKTIPSSFNELYDTIPFFKYNFDDISKLFTLFMDTIITIYDKPDHSKQIIEEHHHTEKVTNIRKVNGKPKKTTTVEDKIVYRHILRTRNGIKRYMAAHKNMKNPPKYTMESWDRAGYVRHLKNGQTIYIEPTTCYRRKELVKDADIHLKL